MTESVQGADICCCEGWLWGGMPRRQSLSGGGDNQCTALHCRQAWRGESCWDAHLLRQPLLLLCGHRVQAWAINQRHHVVHYPRLKAKRGLAAGGGSA